MIVAGLTPTSLVDYPGHPATTVFTFGCPLRCPYCHNPGLVQGPRPHQPLDEQAILSFLAARRDVIGHVCISGGEPTIHGDLPAFLARLKDLGFQVKLDTSGVRPDMLARVVATGLADYVALDVKTAWSQYPKVGLASAAPVRESVEIVKSLALDGELRTTVVPGIVGHEEIAAMAASLHGARRYVLQQFRPRAPLLDPAWEARQPYADAQVLRWAEEISHHFLEPVAVRNLGSR